MPVLRKIDCRCALAVLRLMSSSAQALSSEWPFSNALATSNSRGLKSNSSAWAGDSSPAVPDSTMRRIAPVALAQDLFGSRAHGQDLPCRVEDDDGFAAPREVRRPRGKPERPLHMLEQQLVELARFLRSRSVIRRWMQGNCE